MARFQSGLTGESPIIFTRYSDEFEKPDWTITDKGPFELSNIIQTIQLEAAVKNKLVMIQVALVDPGNIYTDLPEEGREEGQNDEQQQ